MRSNRLRRTYLYAVLFIAVGGIAQSDEAYKDELRLDQKQEVVTNEYATPVATENSGLKSRYRGRAFDYNDYQPPVRKPRPTKSVDITGGLGLLFKLILILAGLFLLYILYRIISDFQYAKKNSLKTVDSSSVRQSTEDLEEEIVVLKDKVNDFTQYSFSLFIEVKELNFDIYRSYNEIQKKDDEIL